MDFGDLLVKVSEAEDIGEDPPVIEVGDGIAEGEKEGGGSGEQISEPIRHGFSGGRTIDGGGVDIGDVGLGVRPVLGGKHSHSSRVELFDPLGGPKEPVADRNGERGVVVVVLDIPFRGVYEGGLIVFNLVFQASDAVLKAVFLLGVCLVVSFEGSGQSFGDVGDQDKAHVVGSFDDRECRAWRERGRLVGGIRAHVFEEVVTIFFASGDHSGGEVLRVWDLDRGWRSGS